MKANSFFNSVYEVVKKIPLGKVTTYGIIADICGNKRMSRQVGWALHVNPDNSTIPCHRVVNRYGELAKSFAFGGINVQKELLLNEGVTFLGEVVDIENCLCTFR